MDKKLLKFGILFYFLLTLFSVTYGLTVEQDVSSIATNFRMEHAIAILGVCATIMTAILKLVPTRYKESDYKRVNDKSEFVLKEVCNIRTHGIENGIADIKKNITRIFELLDNKK